MPESLRPEVKDSSPRRGRARRALRHRLFPVAVAGGALLLLCWPFVRAPSLSLGQAWSHLAVTWGLLIATLAALGRVVDGTVGDEEDVD